MHSDAEVLAALASRLPEDDRVAVVRRQDDGGRIVDTERVEALQQREHPEQQAARRLDPIIRASTILMRTGVLRDVSRTAKAIQRAQRWQTERLIQSKRCKNRDLDSPLAE